MILSPPVLPPAPHQFIASPRNLPALAALEQRARADLATLNFPPPNWVLPATAPEGSQALDVLVVGAGMCGQTAGYALLREGISNIRVIDRNPRGDEGPWATYARMLTLRSPKHLTGPDLDRHTAQRRRVAIRRHERPRRQHGPISARIGASDMRRWERCVGIHEMCSLSVLIG